MKKIITLLITGLLTMIFVSCKEQVTTETKQISKVQVKTTTISQGNISDYLELRGKTVFMNKNTIAAPISGYITQVNVHSGDRVQQNDTLFKIVSSELYALRNTTLKGKDGAVNILAPASGIINQLNVFKNEVFVDKNALLCDIVDVSSLFVETEIPYEYASLAKPGNKCLVQLPDSTEYQARFYKILPEMNEQSQTQKVLTRIEKSKFIPENMIVKVLIEKSFDNKKGQILPKNCVMTDALMKTFWVMKLINDSTAVQIPIKIGKQNHTQAQIISPQFSEIDKIISEGAYGLSDTTYVEVIN